MLRVRVRVLERVLRVRVFLLGCVCCVFVACVCLCGFRWAAGLGPSLGCSGEVIGTTDSIPREINPSFEATLVLVDLPDDARVELRIKDVGLMVQDLVSLASYVVVFSPFRFYLCVFALFGFTYVVLFDLSFLCSVFLSVSSLSLFRLFRSRCFPM